MDFKFLIIFSLIQLTICDNQNTSLNAIVIPGIYNENLQIVVNKTTEYIIIYKGNRENNTIEYPPRVTVYSTEASRIDPVLVVAREKLGILSWQVPLVVETRTGIIEFMNTSRSLCPSNHYLESDDTEVATEQILSVSTAADHNVSVNVLVKHDTEFYITDSVQYNVTISPSEPKYFFYEFKKENMTYKYNYRTVVLQVESDDDVCMMISIQNVNCPVYDLEREIQFEGYWETMTTKGGMTLTQSKFPEGFYVVFVVKGDDYDCTGKDVNNTAASSRVKSLRFQIQPSITYSDYLFAILITTGLIVVFYTIFLGIFCFCSRKYYRAMAMDSLDADSTPTGLCSPVATSSNLQVPPGGLGDGDDSSLSETDYDTVEDAELWKDVYRTKVKLSVADLARKNPKILTKKSNLYLWNVLTIAIFYGMPVIQLVIRYQRALIETGNQDLCYYNFLCAHPLGFLSDFNHVFSNIGYVVLGILFILLVYRRQRMHKDFEFDKNFGIPQHYGLFYAMGCGLIMEGILSGSYHVCPNHYNFQFDSSFMYVMAVLCMVKIYQTRHPDINAKATTTFGILAIAVFLGMVGIMTASLAFWIFFTVIHILTCFVLTAQIYSMGRFKFDGGLFKRLFLSCVHDCRSGPLNALIPRYKGRWFLLFVGNVCNWALAAFGLYHHEHDFATHLLAIFMGNTVLYTLFYIIMKVIHKEKIQIHVCVFLILSFACWFAATYFFIHKSISWALTPAESRQFNYHCTVMSFYDGHDVWHYLSATAMFFSFMLLLTLDDDLSHKHRSQISVF
ncbi:SID1 transmembrane family member 1-like [Chrysoperla carnea]|uniref:SID1 transmembrane family member 1-like n=1 Tax=Chrysoperla carnea TaxID=189513 RepID=UPI001D065D18|nr:SID1 transmembrane family member 1-like [Chrysoperla carnea]